MVIIMKTIGICFILVAFLLPVFAGQALAELDDYSVIQCPGGVISVGDTRFEVTEKCGKPTSVEDNGRIWIYDYGPTEFVRYITFVQDRVERIQIGTYGK
jgi:hypothetical protein